MDDRPTVRQVVYTHSVLEGSAYEIGRQQGEHIRNSPAARFFTSPSPERGPLTPRQAEEAIRFFDKHCPGLNEEIQGFADALGALLEQIVYYAFTFSNPGQCSHMALLPSVTGDGPLYVGRSYEFHHDMSDLRLATTRAAGRAAHVGFSEVMFGRDDGLNEHGLCATIGGEIKVLIV